MLTKVNSTAQNCFSTDPGKAGSGTSIACGSNLCYVIFIRLCVFKFYTLANYFHLETHCWSCSS